MNKDEFRKKVTTPAPAMFRSIGINERQSHFILEELQVSQNHR
jgi:hypothetical protein